MRKLVDAPICQSCSLPMEKDEDHGMDKDGSIVHDYCSFCFQEGKFTEPEITLEQMTERITGFMLSSGKDDPVKVNMSVNMKLRSLKRWQK